MVGRSIFYVLANFTILILCIFILCTCDFALQAHMITLFACSDVCLLAQMSWLYGVKRPISTLSFTGL